MRRLMIACIAAMAMTGMMATTAAADVKVHGGSSNEECPELSNSGGVWAGGCAFELQGPINIADGSWALFACSVSASGHVGPDGLFVLPTVEITGPAECANTDACTASTALGDAKWGGNFSTDGSAYAADLYTCTDGMWSSLERVIEYEALNHSSSSFGLQLFSKPQQMPFLGYSFDVRSALGSSTPIDLRQS